MATKSDVKVIVATCRTEETCLCARTDIPTELVDNVPMPLVNASQAEIMIVVPSEEAVGAQVKFEAVVGSQSSLPGKFSTRTDTEAQVVLCTCSKA